MALTDSFQFVGQAHGGMVPTERALLVLDTNVVSALHGVAKRGFDLGEVRDRRVAHLLRWLAAHPSAAVSPAFGIVEGAGFHRGGLSPYGVVQRALSTIAAVEYGREHVEEWVRSGEPLPDVKIPEDAIHPRNVLIAAELLLPWTVLPSYVAALAAALADRARLEPLAAADAVHRRLVAELDFIPTFAWFAAAVLFLGFPGVRRELRQALFKLQAPDIRQACLSAGWDLGYLQLLSFARSPVARSLFESRLPVLVTEDRQLAPTALLSRCLGNSPLFELPIDLFDPAWRDDAADLLQRRQMERLPGRGRAPEWEDCAEAAARLEAELGIEGAPRLSLHRPVINVESSPADMLAFFRFLRVADAGTVIKEEFDKVGEGAGAIRIVYLAHFVQDNARAHDRDVRASWEAIVARLPPGWEEMLTFSVVVKMTKAAMARDWPMFNAWAEKLEVDSTGGVALLSIWTLGRAVFEDTGTVWSESTEALLDRMIRRAEDIIDRA
ncbi:MAG TPA: hypothetical protein VFM94_02305 [Solirubrobacterales bacterium]|nr:hypothetical protein [Solirubrobacterales bacterium]